MTTYEVSRQILEYNIAQLREQAKNVPIWAVIKGDGYGLGVLPLAEILSEQGIHSFCVTEVREAEILRENAFTQDDILMLPSVSQRETIQSLLDLKVILTVGSSQTAKLVDSIAAERATVARVHLKIDTGMGRYGFLPEETDHILSVYKNCKNLAVTGIYTHFNCAFDNPALTKSEFSVFMNVVNQLRAQGCETGLVHCCNSAAFLKYPQMHCDAVRIGSALLGRVPFRSRLKPVGFVRSQIEELRLLPAGHTTGYSALWRARRPTPVAIVPVGWFHGLNVSCLPDQSRGGACLRMALGNLKAMLFKKRFTVQIKGVACPVVGAIGMLHCAVDVSTVDCKLGDPVLMQLNPLHLKGIPVLFRA